MCLPLSRLAGHLRGRVVSLESLEIIPARAGSFGQDSEYSSSWNGMGKAVPKSLSFLDMNACDGQLLPLPHSLLLSHLPVSLCFAE